MTTVKLKTASVLAFERKLDPSDGVMAATQWQNRAEATSEAQIQVREKSVRGTISNRLKNPAGQDPAKLDAEIQKPNLQRVDVATLPQESDTLVLRFTLRILGGTGIPSACNDSSYQEALEAVVAGYVKKYGFGEIARRYAHNIANGRFLWRNRASADEVEVQVSDGRGQSWTFDALAFSLRGFDVPADYASDVGEFSDVICSGLANQAGRPRFLDIVAHAKMSAGQEVYPSQELVLDQGRGRANKTEKSKHLYRVGGGAAMHSQKIGNALRSIDTWYPDADGLGIGPIAVEPYGSVTTRGTAYRQPKNKRDFYSLLDAWVLKGTVPVKEQQHFVIATLVRGGVFGASQKD